jgi:hypothetical protein
LDADWPGGTLNVSTDNANFTEVNPKIITPRAHFGTTINALGNAGPSSPEAAFSPWTWDTVNTINVSMTVGAFSGSTEADVLTGEVNAVLVGNELVQFVNAVQNEDGSWTLSQLLRGRRGTDWACGEHAVGDSVIKLTGPGWRREDVALSVVGQARYYRAVTVGADITAVASRDFVDTGNDLKPLSPVAIGGTVDSSGDFTIVWLRRTRFGGAYGTGNETLVDCVGGPVNEASESYQVDILNGSTVVRTLSTTVPTAIYTAAQALTDFGSAPSSISVNVYQMSATVGRGWPGAGVCPATTDAVAITASGGGFYVN